MLFFLSLLVLFGVALSFQPMNLGSYPLRASFAGIVIAEPEADGDKVELSVLYVFQDSSGKIHNGDKIHKDRYVYTEIPNDRYIFSDLKTPIEMKISLIENEQLLFGHPLYFSEEYFSYSDLPYYKFRSMDAVLIVSKMVEMHNMWPDIYPICSRFSSPIREIENAIRAVGSPYAREKPKEDPDSLFFKLDRQLLSAGKDTAAFYRSLKQNRDSLRIRKIRSPYISIGAIRGMREIVRDGIAGCEIAFLELSVFKSSDPADDKDQIDFSTKSLHFLDSAFPFNAQKKGACFDLKFEGPDLYLFGWKDPVTHLISVDSIANSDDYFVDNDNLVDISMGYPMEKLREWFLPPEISARESALKVLSGFLPLADSMMTKEQKEELLRASEKIKDYCRTK